MCNTIFIWPAHLQLRKPYAEIVIVTPVCVPSLQTVTCLQELAEKISSNCVFVFSQIACSHFTLFMGSLYLPANHLIIEGIIRPVDPKPLRNVSCPWAKPAERRKKLERKEKEGPPNSVCAHHLKHIKKELCSVPPTYEVTTLRLMMPQMASFDWHNINTS